MKQNKIEKIMMEKYKTALPVLGCTLITGGKAYRSDRQTVVCFPAPDGADDGIYTICGGRLIKEAHEAAYFPPTVSPFAPSATIKTSAAEFIPALKAVSPAQSKDVTRAILNAVCIDFDNKTGSLNLVATDGRRLHVNELPAAVVSDNSFRAALPSGTVKRILKYADLTGDVSIYLDEGHARFEFGELSIACQLEPGTYPDWPQVVPASFEISAEYTVADIEAAMKRVDSFIKRYAKECKHATTTAAVEIQLDRDGNSSIGFNSGEPETSVVVPIKPGRIEFNPINHGHETGVFNTGLFFVAVHPSFLSDAIASAKTAGKLAVRLEADDELTPIKIKSGGFMAAIMTVRRS